MTSRRSFILGVCGAAALRAESDLATLTLAAASDRVRKKTISPLELTQVCLRRIERLNPLLNAFYEKVVKVKADVAAILFFLSLADRG
jgi:hypothetical protein